MRMENFRVLKLLKEETLVRREDWIEFRPVSELLKTKRADWPFIFVDPIGSPPVVASVVRDPNVSRETVERLESILAASNQASQRQQLAMPRLDVANDPVAPIPLAAVNPQEPAPVPPPAIVNEDDDGLQAMININIGPDLQIDIEANDDFNALLDMVGLGGPFLNLFKSLLMYFVISSAIIVITVSLPRTMGLLTISVFKNMIMPLFEIVFGSVSRSLQYITDPIIEPLVDGLLIFGKLVVSFIIGGLEKSVESLAELQISSTLMDVVTNQTIAFLDYLKALSNPVTVTTTFSNASVIAESFGNVTEALQSMDSNVKETVLTALLEAQLTNSYALTILLGYTEMISYLVLSWVCTPFLTI